MLTKPKAIDMFGGDPTLDKADLSVAYDGYMDEIKKAFGNASTNPMDDPIDVEKTLSKLALNKSLDAGVLAGLEAAMETQRTINKEMTITSPLSTGFAAFDLEQGVKLLFPRMTPLRNKMPRKKGFGLAHRAKVLDGISGSETGGVADMHPGTSQTSQAAFNGLNLNRGPQIEQAAHDIIVSYSSFALDNQVSFDAQDSGVPFDDLRAMAVTNTVLALQLEEEKMMWTGRGLAGNGFLGLLVAPTITLTPRAAAGSEVALGSTATCSVYASADAGQFGESVISAGVITAALTSGQVVDVTITVPAAGAIGYRIYATLGALSPATAIYQGRTATLIYTLQGTVKVTGKNAGQVATLQALGKDLSAYDQGYDGIVPILLNGNNNSVLNAAFSLTAPGSEFQAILANIWDRVKGRPQEIHLNGRDRKQLSEAIINGSGQVARRINLSQTEAGDFIGGSTVGALYNETTGDMLDISVSPWLPQGVAPIVSYNLPMPDTNVDTIWAAVDVVPYRGTQWPVIQRSYDNEVSFRGTFMCYAPDWNGIVSGIKLADRKSVV